LVEVVSVGTSAKIDYRILLLILAGVVGFQAYLNTLSDEMDVENSIIVISVVSQLATAIAALVISKRYWGTHVFGKSYLALAVAFFSVFLGEALYNIFLFVYEIDPYPSIADIFFFLLYPFTCIHLILNIRFFQTKVRTVDKLWVIALSIVIILFYSYYSFLETAEINLDFYYGISFVGGAAIITSLSILGTKILWNVPLGRSWLILMIGIMIGTIGDVWYHYLEITESFDTSHIVNLFWYASYWVIVYALYKHGKIF